MARPRKLAPRQKLKLAPHQVRHVLTYGNADYLLGFPFGDDWRPSVGDMGMLEAAWRQVGHDVQAAWATDWPGRKCWAWWQFETTIERDASRPEQEQLFRAGIEPTPFELKAMKRQDFIEIPRHRRGWAWWHERRYSTPCDWTLPEVINLHRHDLLTDEEQQRLRSVAEGKTRYHLLYLGEWREPLGAYVEPALTESHLEELGLQPELVKLRHRLGT